MANLHDGIKGDDWRSMAEVYKKLTVGIAEKPITVMLERTNSMLPFSKATGIYDNGTGPGGVISRIISDYGSRISSSATLSCSDFSGPMIEQVQKAKTEETEKDPKSAWSRLDAQVRDAMDLQGVGDESQSHVMAGWVYFMTADPEKCLSESKRVLQRDGVLCCSSWKESQWMDAAKVVEKVKPGLKTPFIPEDWASAPAMARVLEEAGFREVNAEEVEVTMTFDTREGLVDVLLTKMPATKNLIKDFSEDETARLRQLVSEHIRQASPSEPGTLKGTALVAVGRK